jgi:Protein of unknown function (DUF3168)
MTTPMQAVYSVLGAYAGLQALLTNGDSPPTYRIYNLVAPQSVDAPFLVIQKIAQTRQNTLAQGAGNGVENSRVQCTAYADTISTAEAVAEQVRLALAAAEGTSFAAVQVFNTDQYDADTQLYQVIVDYSVWYRH